MCEVGNVHGVEPRGAARECHEQYGLCVFAKGVAAKEVVPFGEREDENACEDDDDGAVSCDSRVQGDAADFLVAEVENVAELRNGQKSETACQHEDAGGDVHDGIVLETFERVGEQRKSNTAEGADGLEYRAQDAVVHFHGIELREVDDAANEFKEKRKGNHGSEDAASVDVSFLREFGEEDGLVAKSGVHAGKQDKRRRCGHDAETTKLHEDDDEPVPGVGKRR